MIYTVNESLTEIVLDMIMQRFDSQRYPYTAHQTMLPQNHIPESLPLGGAEEFWYWLVVCFFMRGGINSTDSAKALGVMHARLQILPEPNPFKPNEAAEMTDKDIVALMQSVGLGMHQIAPGWVENARRLSSAWQGDPRRLFDGVKDYQTACDRLLQRDGVGLVGFQYKMVSMILYFLMERELIEPFPFPPPVDFHLQRIALATNLVTTLDAEQTPLGLVVARTPSHFKQLETRLRQLYFNYSQSRGLEGNRLTDALWVLSRSLCRRNPGNRTLQVSEYRARGTELLPYKPDWSKESDVRAFERSCGSCPVRMHCHNNAPSMPRYRLGRWHLLPREEPPRQQLFSPLVEANSDLTR
jgi:endonuclease III